LISRRLRIVSTTGKYPPERNIAMTSHRLLSVKLSVRINASSEKFWQVNPNSL
jgi:hypothetical protein